MQLHKCFYSLSLCLVLLMISCTNTSDEIGVVGEIQLLGDIDGYTDSVDTRNILGDADFKTVFEEGDQIGVVVKNQQQSFKGVFTFQGGKWKSDVYLPQGKEYQLSAVYPLPQDFLKDNSSLTKMHLMKGYSSLKELPLMAKAQVNVSDKAVKLLFKPVLSMVQCSLQNSDGNEVNDAMVSIKVKGATMLDMIDGTLTLSEQQWQQPQIKKNHLNIFLLPSQSVEGEQWLKIDYLNKTYYWEKAGMTLESGKVQPIRLSMKREDTTIGGKVTIEESDGYWKMSTFDLPSLPKNLSYQTSFVIVNDNKVEEHKLPTDRAGWNDIVPIDKLIDNTKLYWIYPYIPEGNFRSDEKKFDIPFIEDQTDEAKFDGANRLLISSTQEKGTRVAGSRWSTKDTHLMTRINIHLNSEKLSAEELSKAKVCVNSYRHAQLQFQPEPVLKVNENVQEQRAVSALNRGNGEYSAYIFSNQYLYVFSTEGTSWGVRVVLNGVTYSYQLPLSTEDELLAKPGGVINVSLSIDPIDLNAYANQTKWVYGITPPRVGWEYRTFWRSSRKVFCAPWNKDSGWFATMKCDPANVFKNLQRQDSKQCWIASTSSAIQWWLYQHKNDLPAPYDEVAKKYIPKTVPLSKMDNKKGGYDLRISPLFDEISRLFPDDGGWPTTLIKLFFNGMEYKNSERGGYLKGWVKDRKIFDDYNFRSKFDAPQLFNSVIRDALENKKAILFVTQESPIAQDHAMNIWGADFNDKGIIDALYIVDNNNFYYRSSQQGDMAMIKVPVVYENNRVKIVGYIGNTEKVPIQTVTTLYLNPQ